MKPFLTKADNMIPASDGSLAPCFCHRRQVCIPLSGCHCFHTISLIELRFLSDFPTTMATLPFLVLLSICRIYVFILVITSSELVLACHVICFGSF